MDKEIGRSLGEIRQLDKAIGSSLDEIRQNASSCSSSNSLSDGTGNGKLPVKTSNVDNSVPGVVENVGDTQPAACQTAIRTLEYNEDVDGGNIHPSLAAAPTVVDLDEEKSVNVPGDECENNSIISALSSTDDKANRVAEDNRVPYSIPLPPPAPEALKISGNSSVLEHLATDRAFAGGLADDVIEEKHTTASISQNTQPTAQKDSGYAPVTMEDLNAHWLYHFINPFATFCEETLQSCSESDMVASVESILWPSLMSHQALRVSSSGSSDTCTDNIRPNPDLVRVSSVNSAAIPDTCTGPSFVDDGTLPAEAGIEVRPMKSI